jgi:ribosomal protein S6E (S10)
MAIGAGKYEDLCTMVRKAVGLDEDGELSGAVMVIVLGGNRGNGFSMQSDLESLVMLPEMLEDVARQIRKDRDAIQ